MVLYQVLYRKWRPKTFDDVSGQEHITATLKNEIQENRLNHAYLFTGSRGTGKTTCAKILAKAANCLNPQNGNPCCACDICQGIENGSVLDVVEALREAGAEVLGIASIFTYNMKKSAERLGAAEVRNVSLTDFDCMVDVAAKKGVIRPDDVERLIRFRNNPSDESWIGMKA